MPTFQLTKKISDIVEPVLLPDDWYTLRIVKQPQTKENAALREGGANAPGAGEQIVVNTRVQSETPDQHGRPFTLFLPLPNENDEGEFTARGQTKTDFKIDWIGQVASAFNGYEVESDEVDFEMGQEAQFYVNTRINDRSGEPENQVDRFTPPRPV